jgi:molybdate transport system regulatory protein
MKPIDSGRMTLKPEFHLALHGDSKKVVVDQLDAMLLRRIGETGSITEAAKILKISYRNAWGRLGSLEDKLGKKMVSTTVGGREGGGTELTEAGRILLKEFRRVRKYLFDALDDPDFSQHSSYNFGVRNGVKARVIAVEKGEVISKVTLSIPEPTTLTSIISTEAVNDLELKKDDKVEVIIKSTEVLIGKDR